MKERPSPIMMLQCNNNAASDLESNAGSKNADAYRSRSALERELEKNCECDNCTLASGAHPYRPVTASLIKSPDLSGLSPGSATSSVPTRPNSADIVFQRGSFCPVHDCIWAYDCKYVEQKQAEFPWLPSGSLPHYMPYLDKLGDLKSYSVLKKKDLGYYSESEIRVSTPFHTKKKYEPPFIANSAKTACKTKNGMYQPKIFEDEDDGIMPQCTHQKTEVPPFRRSSSFDQCFLETMKLRDCGEYSLKKRIKLGSSPVSEANSSISDSRKKQQTPKIAADPLAPHISLKYSPQGSVNPAIPPSVIPGRALETVLNRRCQTRVIAFDFEDGVFYPGLIVRCVGRESAIVRFRYTGELCEIPNYLTLQIKDITHKQTLQNADTVLARVKNTKTCEECWIPAQMTGGFLGTPDSRVPLKWRYPVQLFSGARFSFRRRDLIKISPKFFDALVAYIIEKNGIISYTRKRKISTEENEGSSFKSK